MWPLGVYFALVLLLVAGMLVVSYLLGQRHRQRVDGRPLRGRHPVGGLGACTPLGQILPGGDVLRHL